MEELVTEAKRQGVHIRLLLLDKGFYSHEVIKTLKALGVKFLIVAPKKQQGEKGYPRLLRNWEGASGEVQSKEGRRNRQSNSPQVEEIQEGLKEQEKDLKAWSQLLKDYRKREGIETGFRVGKDFRAKTTSKNETVREIYTNTPLYWRTSGHYTTWEKPRDKGFPSTRGNDR